MVFAGKPSGSCGLCRERKRKVSAPPSYLPSTNISKCDKGVPACGTCTRLNQNCPGCVSSPSSPCHKILTSIPDRDTSSLVFKDETTRTITRARHKTANGDRSSRKSFDESVVLPATNDSNFAVTPPSSSPDLSQSNSISPPVPSSTFSTSHTLADLLIPSTQDLAIDEIPDFNHLPSPVTSPPYLVDLGINFFMDNYVVPSGPSPGFCDYAITILNRRDDDDCPLLAAVQAVGLAGIANTSSTNGAALAREARSLYGTALQGIAAALHQSSQAVQDSTVLAIIITGMFETMTCVDEDSMSAWTSHIDGAANLLVHRGSAQFETELGFSIFQEAFSYLLVSYSRLEKPLPPRIRLLRADAARLVRIDDPIWAVCSAHMEVLDLHHQVDPDSNEPRLQADWQRLLLRAFEIDARLDSLFEHLEPTWQYKTVIDPSASPSIVFLGRFHIYHDIWIAKVWIGMRSCRIMLNLIIRTLLQREAAAWAPRELDPGGTYDGMARKTQRTIERLRDDILASVPQMMGFVRHEMNSSATVFDYNLDGTSVTGGAALGCFFVLWHLYLCGSLGPSANNASTQRWITERLKTIATQTGIRKARYLAESLEREFGS